MRRLFWSALTVLGVGIGFVAGLAIAPELPEAARWALGGAVILIFAAVWAAGRRAH